MFIDCLAAAGTLVLGHNHPIVIEAIERALKSELPMQTLDLTTPTKDELFGMLPAAGRGKRRSSSEVPRAPTRSRPRSSW